MYPQIAARVALAAVFLVASVQKGRGRAAFDEFVGMLRALGIRRPGPAVAVGVIAAEVVTAGLLAGPGTADAGLALSLLLLVAFMAGIAVATRRPVPVPCRCFGATGQPLGRRHLVRNAGLAVLAVVGLLAPRLVADTALLTGGVILSVLGGLILALVFVRWDDVAYLVSPPGP